MIKYDRFWVTMKERGITQYDLYEHYQITRSLLDRLRKNKNVEIYTCLLYTSPSPRDCI